MTKKQGKQENRKIENDVYLTQTDLQTDKQINIQIHKEK